MADRYWITGGNTNWYNTANWSTMDGGAGGAAIPTYSDDVFLTAASGSGMITANYVYPTQTSCDAKNFNCTGFTGTFSPGVYVKMSGNLTLSSLMTWSSFAGIGFENIANATLNLNGNTTYYFILINIYAGTVDTKLTLNDDIILTAGGIALYHNGGAAYRSTFDANGYDITITETTHQGNIIECYQGDTIKMGSGTWTLTCSDNDTLDYYPVWAIDAGAIIDCGTSTLIFNDNSNVKTTFDGRDQTYYNVINNTTGTGGFYITGNNTFNNLTFGAGSITKFKDGTTQTTISLTATGTSSDKITLQGTGTAGWTISDTTGTNTCEYLNLSNSTAIGGATWEANYSLNNNTNTGWTFTLPPPYPYSTGSILSILN